MDLKSGSRKKELEANIPDLVTEDGLNQGSAEEWTDKRGI